MKINELKNMINLLKNKKKLTIGWIKRAKKKEKNNFCIEKYNNFLRNLIYLKKVLFWTRTPGVFFSFIQYKPQQEK